MKLVPRGTRNAEVKIHFTPKIAQRGPYPVKVEAGKTYYWHVGTIKMPIDETFF
jgi:hypothetical protein